MATHLRVRKPYLHKPGVKPQSNKPHNSWGVEHKSWERIRKLWMSLRQFTGYTEWTITDVHNLLIKEGLKHERYFIDCAHAGVLPGKIEPHIKTQEEMDEQPPLYSQFIDSTTL